MLRDLILAIERARDTVLDAVKGLRPEQAEFKPSQDERLEFLRFHMERHLDQIRRIQSDPAYPK